MMRRYQEPEAPFRVLSLYSPEPLARAPEPYKVAPQASSYGRSQRKSSFAIIAETRPPSPQALAVSSRPGSPQLSGSGRLSPFRGRGFKEPARPTARHDRRASLSQQNSPKRSQIPRPARSRSISSSKERQIGGSDAARKASPKFGRRAANRYNSSVGNGNQRRMPQKEAAAKKQLSPIQGTPTRPSPDRKKQSLLKGKPAAGSPEKINRNLLAPPKLPPGGRRFVTAKTPAPRTDPSSKQGPDSPSKIPLRRGSVSNSNSNIASQPAKQLPSKPANPTGVQTQAAAGNDAPEPPDEAFKVISSKKKKSSTKQAADEDLGIVDLLKQSSGATGTSSVVNTTTTTAVQPLQIDASSILAESELVAKLSNLERQQKMEMEKSAESQKPSPTPNKSQETEPKPSPREAAKDEKTGAKNGNMTQTMIKHFGPTANNEEKEKSGNNNISVAPAATDTKPGKESKATAEMEKAKEEKKTAREEKKSDESEKQNESSAAAGHKKTDSKSSEPKKPSRAPSPSNNSADDSAKKKKKQPPADTTLKSQAQAVSSESLGSLRSTDTGVSVNTVRGVSSAKEKSGLVKRPEEIETLSGNIVHLESNGEQHAAASAAGTDSKAATSRWQRLKGRCWPRRKVKPKAKAAAEGRKRAAKLVGSCWPEMRCLACKRDPKAQLWPGKQARAASRTQLTSGPEDKPAGRWARIKEACRCAQTGGEGRWYSGWRRLRHRQQVAPARPGPARRCWPFGRRRRASEGPPTRRPTVRAKHSLTSVAAPAPASEETRPKIPDVLVEHNSVMRGAIPCLPVPLAWFCLACNVLLPGSGTVLSGLFNLCAGQPRFSATASPKARFGSLIVNLVVGLSQLFTVLFCLVGWGWSIWWGVTMIRLARKYKRFRDSEAAANDPEARGAGPETATLPAPGVPATALRGMERAR